MNRGRTLRLDLSSVLYAALEEKAMKEDVGVPDFVRFLIVKWMDEEGYERSEPRS